MAARSRRGRAAFNPEPRLTPRFRWPGHGALHRAAHELGVRPTPAQLDAAAQEQLRMLLDHTRPGTVAATVFAMLLARHVADQVPTRLLLVWVALKLLLAAARLMLAHAHAKPAAGGARWRRSMLILLAADGLVWGLGGCWLMDQPEATVATVVASIDAVSCVAAFGLQVSTLATAAYTGTMLLPLALGMALRHDSIALTGALGQLVLLALLLASAWASSRRLAGGTLLRLQAQTLVEQKDAALTLAQQQSALRTQFLAKVSHELRTPLHGMLGLARLMHLEATDRQAKRRLELLEGSGTHLLALINDLLDVARIDSGRFALHEQAFDLSAQLDQVAEVFALRAADKGLGFALESTLPRPCWVHGDAARLRQVLHNLLGNAVKFTHAGGIRMVVTAGVAPEQVRIAVHDSGQGIAEAERLRIFHAFQQLDAGGSRPTDGVGLGLTIAREIASAMGGDIEVSSTPGQGSCFTFSARLPRVAPSAEAPEAEAAEGGRLPRLVLVAEDDEVNAMIVAAFLQRQGVRCERVPDGKQAVARALRETDRPDLVLMDMRMPVMDGPTATREIRRQERTLGLPRLPIVALTATVAEHDVRDCLAAGMDEVVGKPFTPEQLARALRGAGNGAARERAK